ncbi:hypothetical protein RHSP_33198 [Rhizobium freirei PRF 81]|uniref:Uncharacterized protein n=1 Tax=Rhizobium freirei PRF 81 TaxID=363754 RepID=N6U0F5_9HYPH|nr:hypothetical protein RHSP_33198 [Rhizobium freirei PRF 81]
MSCQKHALRVDAGQVPQPIGCRQNIGNLIIKTGEIALLTVFAPHRGDHDNIACFDIGLHQLPMSLADGVAAMQEDDGRFQRAFARMFRDPGDEFQFTAKAAAIEKLIGGGWCRERLVNVGSRPLAQQVCPKQTALLAVVARQQWRRILGLFLRHGVLAIGGLAPSRAIIG